DEYQSYIAEKVEPWSYLKSPYYRPLGYPNGIYRVGPLARLNVHEVLGTPEADQEFLEYRGLAGTASSSFYFHYAYMIEIFSSDDRIEYMLSDTDILGNRGLASATANVEDSIGVTDAPRGTLNHHYTVDELDRVVWPNLVNSPTHNTLPM